MESTAPEAWCPYFADVEIRCYGRNMIHTWASAQKASAEPAHVPSGAALLALELAQSARGMRGLDVLRRSVDRAPPA